MHVNYTIPKVHLTVTSNNLWHQGLGHPGPAVLKKLGLPTNDAMCTYDQFIQPPSPDSITSSQITDQATSYKITKFLGKKFELLARAHGFVHSFSPPETPQHNGFSEWSNRTILDKAKCLLNSCNLPSEYWAEAVNTAVLLSNLTPTQSRDNKSPYYLWTGREPRLNQLRTFGCLAFMAIPKLHRSWKLAPAGERGAVLGYENNNTSYRILWLHHKKVAITKHATFDETSFPSLNQDHSPADTTTDRQCFTIGKTNPITASREPQELNNHSPPLEMTEEPHAEEDVPTKTRIEAPQARRIRVIGPRHPTLVNSNIDNLNILPYSQRANILLTSLDTTPQTFKAALILDDHDLWKEAIYKELEAMINLKVWEVTGLEDNRKLIGTTWVFKTKQNLVNGQKLCTHRETQLPADPHCLCCSKKPTISSTQCEEHISKCSPNRRCYLSIPQGLNICRQSHCLKLKKATYGLRQAPLAWYDCLKKWLTSVGFRVCILDPCIFFRSDEPSIWLYLHVDDLGVFGKDVHGFKKEIDL
ncbi:hypothetical protein O181_091872 [Austropuccinia psidii MF-1]|uniref:Integrase catalytic domain-containing protein n=1 Tax=Austropuccinia psidii MF-1 TaxID=1389203 RepID=A0A9Q3P917_9BASI|nr:hypothetical protein [Austropuccinia psidii MF-1]